MPERFPLSVVLVLATSTGGIGQHVRSLAAGLCGRGVAVTVAGPAQTQKRFDFRAVGARFSAVEIATGPRPVTDAVAVRRLRELFETADVVHAHGLRAGMLSGLAAGRRRATRLPLVVTWHNAILAGGPKRALLERLARQVARRADVTLGASTDLVDRARELGALDARF
ncbi:glycosyltransferase, partial [Carbonactinospora thermoautotrophica]